MTSPLGRFSPPAADGALPVPGPALATDHPLRVLSLFGGGFLGLYTAVVLEALEAQAGEPLARRFDLLAGTSIGGCASAVATSRTAACLPSRPTR